MHCKSLWIKASDKCINVKRPQSLLELYMKSNCVLQSKVRFQYEFVLFLKQVFIKNIRDKVDTPNKQNWECFSQRATSEKWNVLLLLSCWSHVTAALDSQTSGLFSCSLLQICFCFQSLLTHNVWIHLLFWMSHTFPCSRIIFAFDTIKWIILCKV